MDELTRSHRDGNSGPAADDNQHVLIIHDVADYAKWKSIFDEAAQIRREAGEIEYQLLRAAGDQGPVIHFSRWTSLNAARVFFESPRLVEIRRQAGVQAPEFHYLCRLESAVL